MKLEYEFIGEPEYDFTGKWQGGRRVYILIRDCFIIINGKVYKIPKGYEWDGWTIPMFIQNFFVFDSLNSYIPMIVLLAISIFLAGDFKNKLKYNRPNNILAMGVSVCILILGFSLNSQPLWDQELASKFKP